MLTTVAEVAGNTAATCELTCEFKNFDSLGTHEAGSHYRLCWYIRPSWKDLYIHNRIYFPPTTPPPDSFLYTALCTRLLLFQWRAFLQTVLQGYTTEV